MRQKIVSGGQKRYQLTKTASFFRLRRLNWYVRKIQLHTKAYKYQCYFKSTIQKIQKHCDVETQSGIFCAAGENFVIFRVYTLVNFAPQAKIFGVNFQVSISKVSISKKANWYQDILNFGQKLIDTNMKKLIDTRLILILSKS